MLKPFERNVFGVQTIERFVRGGNVTFRQITLTTCSQRESEGVCFYRRWFVCMRVCVCLSVTTITKKIVDGFVPNFM